MTALHEFHRHTGSNTKRVKAGDIVLIHDNTPRIQRRLAVIEKVNKGADGLIHSANVRTSTGRTNRPITKLYPFEVTATEQSTPSHDDTGRESTTTSSRPQLVLEGSLTRMSESTAVDPFLT